MSGASRLALRLRLTPTVIGLTVVAAGTSLPELVVSVIAQLKGSPALAVGNVVGSNIFNIGMVLGLLALIRPLPIPGSTARLEFPVLLAASLSILWLGRGQPPAGFDEGYGWFSPAEGRGMLVVLVIFVAATIRSARRLVTETERAEFEAEVSEVTGAEVSPTVPLAWPIAQVILGAAGLWLGGKWLIDGSIDVALAMGISERIVGLTVVAGGTGAPELVASIIAVRRGKADLAVGNVLGSNIFNLLAILGVGASIGGLAAPMEILQWDVWWMLALTLLLVPLFFRADTRIRRLEGGVILATYLAYIGSLIVRG